MDHTEHFPPPGDSSSAQPTYAYVNELDIDDELKCPVCFDPLLVPAVCQNCRNTFCRACVEFLTKCPFCREDVHPLQEPPRLLLNLLGKLSVKCNVCFKQVRRADFQSHTHDECPISCLWGCDAILTRATLSGHQDSCPYMSVPCKASDVGCTLVAPRMSVDSHLSTCPFWAVRPLLLSQQTRIQLLEEKVQDLESRQLLGTSAPQTKKLPLTIKFNSFARRRSSFMRKYKGGRDSSRRHE